MLVLMVIIYFFNMFYPYMGNGWYFFDISDLRDIKLLNFDNVNTADLDKYDDTDDSLDNDDWIFSKTPENVDDNTFSYFIKTRYYSKYYWSTSESATLILSENFPYKLVFDGNNIHFDECF